MDSVSLRTYKTALYAAQFVVTPESLESLSHALPRLLSSLRVEDETLRIRLIEKARNLISDFQRLDDTLSDRRKLTTRTSRTFIRHFVVVFSVLSTGASYKKIFTLWRTPLRTGLSLSELFAPARYAASSAAMLTTLPLIKSNVVHDRTAQILHPLLSLSLMPEGYSKDYASVYFATQALENTLDLVTKKVPYWWLLPLSFSEILHLASTTPSYLPNSLARCLVALYSGFVERKPRYYNKDWPDLIELLPELRFAQKPDRSLLHVEPTVSRFNPLHSNARFSLLSPSNPSLRSVVLRNAPMKALSILSITFPAILLIKDLRRRFTSDNSDLRGQLRESSKESLRLTLTTLLAVITSYVLLTTRLSPRLNGFISGLWFYLYKDTASAPLCSFLARVTLRATFRQHRDRLSRTGVLGAIAGQWASTIIGALGIAQLYQLQGKGQLQGRMQTLIEYIQKGGASPF